MRAGPREAGPMRMGLGAGPGDDGAYEGAGAYGGAGRSVGVGCGS